MLASWWLNQEQENGLAHRVLFDLAENYLDKGYRIYLDNFYSTVKFFQDLENRQTYGCDTIGSDRGRFPASFKQKLERWEPKFMRIGNLFLYISVKIEISMLVPRFKGLMLRLLKQNMVILSPNQKLLSIKATIWMEWINAINFWYRIFGRITVRWWKKVFLIWTGSYQ